MLPVSTAQANWLQAHQTEAQTILDFLSENGITASTESAAMVTIDAMMFGIVESTVQQQHYNLVVTHNSNISTLTPAAMPGFMSVFSVNCALVKLEHPSWPKWQVYLTAMWRTMSEVVHTGLDIAGLVPVIGEIADLANGIIYTLEGDGVNASLSFAATVPVAGWFATGVKYAKKTINLATGSVTLKWLRKTDGLIDFGDRGDLRKVLGLATGDPKRAHHMIPWQWREHPVIQKAAQGQNPFHMNEAINGFALDAVRHNGSHNAYNTLVYNKLQQIANTYGNNLTPQIARQELEQLLNSIRTAITNNPNTHINNLAF